MDETYKPYVEKLIAGGMKTAEDVAKFVETQTPELGKEIIMWGAVSETIAPLMGMLILASAIYIHSKCSHTETYYTGSHNENPPGVPFVIAFGLLGFGIFAAEILDVFYPLVAPRMYILEKVSSFIK